MSRALIELLDDVAALKAMIAERDAKIAELEHNVECFRRMLFGSSSEKRRGEPRPADHACQAHLFCAELLAEAERVACEKAVEGSIELVQPAQPRKPSKRRAKFPEHIPHVTTIYELPVDQRHCACGGELHEISKERTRELERLETSIVHER